MALAKTATIVLNSRRWGDADRILTLYTLRFGKIRGVARGARRLKSRLGGALEPFMRCDLDLFEKPGDGLFRITQASLIESYTKLREDLTLMMAAARMVNLVAAVTADGDRDPEIFHTLEGGLAALSRSRDAALTTLLFQVRVLGVTGFKPQTDHCTSCGRGSLHELTMFSPKSGGLVCERCASREPARCLPFSRGSSAFLQQALRLEAATLGRLHASGQIRREVETAIESYVSTVIGRRLPSLSMSNRLARVSSDDHLSNQGFIAVQH